MRSSCKCEQNCEDDHRNNCLCKSLHMAKNIQFLFAILFFAASLGHIKGAAISSELALRDAQDKKREKAESISAEGVCELVGQSSKLPQPLCMLIKKYAEICCPHEFFKLPFSPAVQAKMDNFFPPDSLERQKFALSLEPFEPRVIPQSHSYSGMYQVTCYTHCLEVRDRMGCSFMTVLYKDPNYLCGLATAINDTHVAALVYSKENNTLSVYIWRIGKKIRNIDYLFHCKRNHYR